MNLMPIAEFIEGAGLGVMGETLFINTIPADAPKGVLLRNHLSGTKIDYELPGYYKTGFRVIVRARDYQEGEALIEEVCAALTVQHKRVGNMDVIYMRPLTDPVVFPMSGGNLLEFATDIDIVFTRS